MQSKHSNFLGLKEEKRDKIINAALLEFSGKGYDLASTNEMIKLAGISKGALFHYFSSKKELFLFLCDYVFDIVRREFYEQIGHCDGDLLKRYSKAARLKGTLYLRYPMLFAFTRRLPREQSAEIVTELKAAVSETTEVGYRQLFGNLDETLFRPDVPMDKLKDLITWALENYGIRSNELVGHQKLEDIDMDALNDDFYTYIAVLRKCFYRQEGQR